MAFDRLSYLIDPKYKPPLPGQVDPATPVNSPYGAVADYGGTMSSGTSASLQPKTAVPTATADKGTTVAAGIQATPTAQTVNNLPGLTPTKTAVPPASNKGATVAAGIQATPASETVNNLPGLYPKAPAWTPPTRSPLPQSAGNYALPGQGLMGPTNPGHTGGTAGQAPVQAQESSDGRWVNFNRYLEANRQGAAGMADSITGRVQGKAGAAENAVYGRQQQFGKDLLANAPRYYGGEAIGGQDQSGGPGGIDVATGRPALSVAEAQGLAGQTYKGPTSITDPEFYKDSTLGKDVDTAGREAAQLGTSEGRQALLDDQYKATGDGRSRGISRFDSALVDGVDNGSFGATANRFKGLQDYLTSATSGSAQDAQGYKDATGKAAQSFGTALQNYKPPALAPPDEGPPAEGVTPGKEGVLRDPGTGAATSVGAGGQAVVDPLQMWGQTNEKPSYQGSVVGMAGGGEAYGQAFTMAGGSAKTWESMTNEEWLQYQNLYNAAKGSMNPASKEAQAMQTYVQHLINRYGK